MSLKAESLKINPNKKRAIAKEIRDILGRIDEEIKTAYDHDECHVHVSVPITFAIPGMSNKNAQRSIYVGILTSLKDRGFHVKLYITEEQTVFFIRWLSQDEENEIKIQNALLAKHVYRK